MAFCPKCGREVSADAAFCAACGASLRPSGIQSAQGAARMHKSFGGMLDFARSRNPSFGLLLSGMAIILDILAVPVAFVQLSAGLSLFGGPLN